MSGAAACRRWHAAPREALAWREWGDEHVFRVADTGALHLVSALAGQTVRDLLERPGGATAADLLATLADDNPPDAADVEALEQLLAQLEAIGLTRSEPI